MKIELDIPAIDALTSAILALEAAIRVHSDTAGAPTRAPDATPVPAPVSAPAPATTQVPVSAIESEPTPKPELTMATLRERCVRAARMGLTQTVTGYLAGHGGGPLDRLPQEHWDELFDLVSDALEKAGK